MTNDRHLYHWKESTGKPLIRKSLPINSILPTCSIQAGYGQIKGSHHSSIACCQIVPRRQTKQLWSIKGNHQQLLYLYMENPISMLIYIYIYIYQTITLPPGRIQILPCHVVAPIAQVLGCEEQPSWRRSIAMKVPRKVWVMDAPNLILLALEIFWGTVSLPG